MKLRITSKLLLAILLTNVIIIVVLALYLRDTFERGFRDYLNQAEAAQLSPLLKSLAAWHERGGEFESLQSDMRQWHDLLLQSLPGVSRAGRGFPGQGTRQVYGWARHAAWWLPPGPASSAGASTTR